MVLYKVTLVLRSKVYAPIYGELELVSVGNSLLENLDTLCLFQTYKLGVHD